MLKIIELSEKLALKIFGADSNKIVLNSGNRIIN